MKLEKWLKKNNLRYEEFAEQLGVSRGSVFLWRTGKFKPMKIYQQKIKEFTNGEVTEKDWGK